MTQSLWHWVITGTTPRMATENSLDAEPAAFKNTVLEHRFDHILTTSRCEATGRRRERRDENTVEIYRQKEKLSQPYFPLIFFSALHTAFSTTA